MKRERERERERERLYKGNKRIMVNERKATGRNIKSKVSRMLNTVICTFSFFTLERFFSTSLFANG